MANLLLSAGFKQGESIALFMENRHTKLLIAEKLMTFERANFYQNSLTAK